MSKGNRIFLSNAVYASGNWNAEDIQYYATLTASTKTWYYSTIVLEYTDGLWGVGMTYPELQYRSGQSDLTKASRMMFRRFTFRSTL